jgi:ribosomal protein L11 methyltransferase
MDWLQLHLVAPAPRTEALEDALLSLGAVAVTLGERGGQPVLEPGVGEMPLWPEVALSALFEHDTPRAPVLAALGEGFEPAILASARWEVLADRPWERAWLQHFAPIRCGERLWVCPHGADLHEEDAIILRLDPGLAFGTGTHPTTALCLEWLDAHPPAGLEVIDYGCGSGILGIAALLLGARRVHAVDIDPQALLATRENGERNGVEPARLLVGPPDALDPGQGAGLLLANILAGPLCELAPSFATLLRPGACAVLSGVLGRAQADAVRAACAPWFETLGIVAREDWWRIELRRSQASA